MLKRLRIPALLLYLSTMLLSAHAQPIEVASVAVPFAAVINNQLWVYQPGTAPVQIPTPDALVISYVRWSADGRYIAALVYNGNTTSLLVATPDGQWSARIADEVSTGFPVTFSPDSGGRVIYAQFSPDSKPDSGSYKIALYSAPIQGRGPLIVLGTFEYGAGCGGGSIIPADWIYSQETHSLGGFYETLEVTPFGILHSVDCGGDQTALLNPDTGTDTLLSNHFGRVKLSPDGTRAAGIELNVSMDASNNVVRTWRLLMIDLATGQMTELPTTAEPDQLAWSANGQSVYYSTRTESGDLYRSMSAEDQAKLDQAMGFSIGNLLTYTASIWQIDLASSTASQIYSSDSYAIGRMLALPDGSGLYFSQIPNLGDWVDGLMNGTIDFNGDPASQYQSIPVEVYHLNLTDHQITPIGEQLGQITFPG